MCDTLDGKSFEEWCDLVFTTGASAQAEKKLWEYTASNLNLVRQCTRLFAAPAFLRKTFSSQTIRDGLLAVVGGNGFMTSLSDPKVDVDERTCCIDSMEMLFAYLFSVDPCETLCFMWFDLLYSFSADDYGPLCGDPVILKRILRVLDRILQLESRECRRSALHGLGHLHGFAPDTVEKSIELFLASESVDEDLAGYARVCQGGGMQ